MPTSFNNNPPWDTSLKNNAYGDKKTRYEIEPVTIRTVDQAVVDYFDKKLAVTVDVGERERKKVPVVFASPERWKSVRDGDSRITREAIRDEQGTLILPVISIRRTDIDRTKGFGGMAQEVPSITITQKLHQKTPLLQNLYYQRRLNGWPEPKQARDVYEVLTLPFPDFCTILYEILIWTQYQAQMNDILEKIFYRFEFKDSFVMPVYYDKVNTPNERDGGKGYYFVGFRDGNITNQSNVEDFTDKERIIRYGYTIKVPAYFLLQPDDEPLAYGRDMGERTSTGRPVVYKQQTEPDVIMQEKILSLDEFNKMFSK